jgi:hypothetical protein
MPPTWWEDVMWFRKPAPVICAVCGKAIDPRERRFVEKNRTIKIERHTHVKCASDASAPST